MEAQKPLVAIGMTAEIGDWRGKVETIRPKGGVIILLDNGKRMPVDRGVVEKAVFGHLADVEAIAPREARKPRKARKRAR